VAQKKKAAADKEAIVPEKLTEAGQDLLSHLDSRHNIITLRRSKPGCAA
jgi:hypothetical protein